MVSGVGSPSSWRDPVEPRKTTSADLSFLVGPSEPPLSELTLGQLLKGKAAAGSSRPCLIFPEADYRATYGELYERTLEVAKGLLEISSMEIELEFLQGMFQLT